jgi:hypothetical protein
MFTLPVFREGMVLEITPGLSLSAAVFLKREKCCVMFFIHFLFSQDLVESKKQPELPR